MLSLHETWTSLSLMKDCWEIGMRYPAGTKVWRQRNKCHELLLNRLTQSFKSVSAFSWSQVSVFTSVLSCPGVRGTALTGVSPASLSEFAVLSSLSRKVSKLCSSVWVTAAPPGVLTNSGSRWRARGEGRLESWLARWAFRRACRISHSFGEVSYRGPIRRVRNAF